MHAHENACSLKVSVTRKKAPFFGTEEDTSMHSRCSNSIISHKHYLKVKFGECP
jgi:hypothetical protein